MKSCAGTINIDDISYPWKISLPAWYVRISLSIKEQEYVCVCVRVSALSAKRVLIFAAADLVVI